MPPAPLWSIWRTFPGSTVATSPPAAGARPLRIASTPSRRRPAVDPCRSRARQGRNAVRGDHRPRIPDAVARPRADERRADGDRRSHDPQLRAQPGAVRVAGAVRFAHPRSNRPCRRRGQGRQPPRHVERHRRVRGPRQARRSDRVDRSLPPMNGDGSAGADVLAVTRFNQPVRAGPGDAGPRCNVGLRHPAARGRRCRADAGDGARRRGRCLLPRPLDAAPVHDADDAHAGAERRRERHAAATPTATPTATRRWSASRPRG